MSWCHNERDGVPDLQPHDCLLNRLFRRRSQKTSKPVTGEFPAQRDSNAENVSIWWRHHGISFFDIPILQRGLSIAGTLVVIYEYCICQKKNLVLTFRELKKTPFLGEYN